MYELQVINIATLIAVVAGGIGMGVYLACATKCGYMPSLVTLIVLGWSFLLPLSLSQMAEGDVNFGRLVERLALWALFSVHARIGGRIYARWKGSSLRTK
jgi:hypothetical protein